MLIRARRACLRALFVAACALAVLASPAQAGDALPAVTATVGAVQQVVEPVVSAPPVERVVAPVREVTNRVTAPVREVAAPPVHRVTTTVTQAASNPVAAAPKPAAEAPAAAAAAKPRPRAEARAAQVRSVQVSSKVRRPVRRAEKAAPAAAPSVADAPLVTAAEERPAAPADRRAAAPAPRQSDPVAPSVPVSQPGASFASAASAATAATALFAVLTLLALAAPRLGAVVRIPSAWVPLAPVLELPERPG